MINNINNSEPKKYYIFLNLEKHFNNYLWVVEIRGECEQDRQEE